jgi:hemerythrin superfamily protein
MADALALLTEDHQRLDQLYDELGQTEALPRRRQLVEAMIEALSGHMTVEEGTLYPAVAERATGGRGFVESNREEHAQARDCLGKLAAMSADDPRFDPTIGELMKKVQSHVAAEELQLFPRVRVSFSAEELQTLGERLGQARSPEASPARARSRRRRT